MLISVNNLLVTCCGRHLSTEPVIEPDRLVDECHKIVMLDVYLIQSILIICPVT